MYILEADKISLSYGDKTVLDGVTFSVNQGDRVGVVGINGAGKTTLFEVLSGENTKYAGNVFIARGKTVGYLKQLNFFSADKTVIETAYGVFSELIALENKLELINKKMLSSHDERTINEFTSVQNEFIRRGGYEFRKRAKGCLSGMGFDENMFDLPVSALSGGQKTTLQLALLLLEEPDILLLDEPTNHLDIKSLVWLEDMLSRLKSTVIVISHDRFFLDKVTTKTLEIENGKGKLYPCAYTEYRERKKKDREIQERHYKNQQKEIKRMEEFIAQQRRWNREKNIIAAESRQKALDRMVKVEKVSAPQKKLAFDFKSSIESGNDVLFVKNLGKAYGDKTVFSGADFAVRKNDRLVIIGTNGSGKSTLLQIIAGKIPQSVGSFEFGYNVRVGYYDQNLLLDEDLTVLEEVWNDSDMDHTHVRSLLDTFLFRGDDVFKKISVLSGGERARVALAKLMQKKVNLLLLDEPTNHLDIDSCEALEEAVRNFDGTVIAVSHDRYFINSLASRILEFNKDRNGSDTFLFEGNYASFLEYEKKLKANSLNTETEKEISDSTREYLERKKSSKERQKLEKQKNILETKMRKAEEEIAELEKKIPDFQSDYVELQKIYERKEELLRENDESLEKWCELDEELNS